MTQVFDLLARAEQAHRANRALQTLVQRGAGQAARVVTLGPKLAWEKRPAEGLRVLHPGDGLPARPLVPPVGHAALTLGLEACAVLACDVTGLSAADLEAAVGLVEQRQRRGEALRPVFLTDARDFGPMAQRGYVVEFLPRGVTDGEREFIARKWGVAEWLDLRETKAPQRADSAPNGPNPNKVLPSVVPIPPVAVPRSAPVGVPIGAPVGARGVGKRKKAAVIAWDLGHNPVGRAMVIYDLLERDWDVELVGPIWSRFGGRVWGPIADSDRKVRGFACSDFADYWPAAMAFASAADYDLVVACKPRLPSLLLAALIKERCGCPLVLDVDDFELSFFPDESGAPLEALEAAGLEALREPYGELATRVADGVIADADSLIVSNIALRNRFGGILVRHARDEAAFHPDRFDRAAERARMGMTDEDFALVFVGTARAHKGVFDIARTLAALPDKRFVLHLVGTITDRRIRAEMDRHSGARIVYHPDCAFEELPAQIVAADAVVLLQDPAHPISQYQIPAKISDASAFGLPILVTDVPPLRDLALQGMVTVVAPADLGSRLVALQQQRDQAGASRERRAVREAFEQELGYRVNRERLELAITRAEAAGWELPASFRRLIEIAAKAHAESLAQPSDPPTGKGASRRSRVGKAAPEQFDIVMFWKQNDSGIYGRRSDMMMQYLLKSGRVGRVLQIDAPMEVNDLARLTAPGGGSASTIVLHNVIANQYGLRDSSTLLRRTYIWDRKGGRALLPEVGASMADYPAWVEAQMTRAGIDPARAFAWVCPVVFDFPAIARRIPFRGVIGDLIDDQRNFGMAEAYRKRITASYDETLPLFDLTFTNCAPQADAFAALARDIRVVPNGTERIATEGPVPDILKDLRRPLAGYIGNLRDRIDWALLHATATAMPDVHFVIIGGGAREGDTDALEKLANVTFTGVVPYEQVHPCMRALDVALVPHLHNALSKSMNPLKIYNYFSAGCPIISTEVENIDAELLPFIRFASDTAGFAAAIRAALQEGPRGGRTEQAKYRRVLDGITWEARVTAVLAELDAWVSKSGEGKVAC